MIERFFWALVTIAGIFFAGHLISESVADWMRQPTGKICTFIDEAPK